MRNKSLCTSILCLCLLLTACQTDRPDKSTKNAPVNVKQDYMKRQELKKPLHQKGFNDLIQESLYVKNETPNAEARFILRKAVLAFKNKEKTESINFAEESIKLDTQYAYGYYVLGVIYYAEGKLEKSVQYFTKAKELDPGYSPAVDPLINQLKKLTK